MKNKSNAFSRIIPKKSKEEAIEEMKLGYFPEPCDYATKCPLYSPDSHECNFTGGYFGSKPAGCVIIMQNKNNIIKKKKIDCRAIRSRKERL